MKEVLESLTYFNEWQRIYEERLKSSLKKDSYISKHLPLLLKGIEKSRKAFEVTGSFSFCAKCASSGTKCCERGLEWMVSPAEFLLNLLLFEKTGKRLKLNIDRKTDCLFLGEKGCALIYTPIFCRNFFCPELSEFLGKEKLTFIQKEMEDEARLGFVLSDYITKKYILEAEKEVKRLLSRYQ